MGIEQPLLQMEEAHKRDTVKEKLVGALIYKQTPTSGLGTHRLTRGSTLMPPTTGWFPAT